MYLKLTLNSELRWSESVAERWEIWMKCERRGCGIRGEAAPVFTTIRFLSFPSPSKQRQWDSAALSCAVIHRRAGLTQCGPDNHRILYQPGGSTLLQILLFINTEDPTLHAAWHRVQRTKMAAGVGETCYKYCRVAGKQKEDKRKQVRQTEITK